MPDGSSESFVGWVMYAFVVYWIASSWYAHLTRFDVTEDVLQRTARPVDTQSVLSSEQRPPVDDREALLVEILRQERIGSIDAFLARALERYEKIIAALNASDRKALQGLVSSDVYRAFEQVIAEREADRTHIETLFACIDTPEIVDGTVDATRMEVSIRFIAQAFSLCRNEAGQLLDERPMARRTVDVWTFARKLAPRGSDWRVIATGPEA